MHNWQPKVARDHIRASRARVPCGAALSEPDQNREMRVYSGSNLNNKRSSRHRRRKRASRSVKPRSSVNSESASELTAAASFQSAGSSDPDAMNEEHKHSTHSSVDSLPQIDRRMEADSDFDPNREEEKYISIFDHDTHEDRYNGRFPTHDYDRYKTGYYPPPNSQSNQSHPSKSAAHHSSHRADLSSLQKPIQYPQGAHYNKYPKTYEDRPYVAPSEDDYVKLKKYNIKQVKDKALMLFDVKLTQDKYNWFKRNYKHMNFGYHRRFKSGTSRHPGLRCGRETDRHLCYDRAASKYENILTCDSGAGHKRMGHIVHCCQPEKFPKDILRSVKLKGTGITKCKHDLLSCVQSHCCNYDIQYQPFCILMIHVLYYFTPDQICEIFEANPNMKEIIGAIHRFDTKAGSAEEPYFGDEGFWHRGSPHKYNNKSDDIVMKVEGEPQLYHHYDVSWLTQGTNMYEYRGTRITWLIIGESDYSFRFIITRASVDIRPVLCCSNYSREAILKMKSEEEKAALREKVIIKIANKCAHMSVNPFFSGKVASNLRTACKDEGIEYTEDLIEETLNKVYQTKDRLTDSIFHASQKVVNNVDNYNAVIQNKPVDAFSWFTRTKSIKYYIYNYIRKKLYQVYLFCKGFWDRHGQTISTLIKLYITYRICKRFLKMVYFVLIRYYRPPRPPMPSTARLNLLPAIHPAGPPIIRKNPKPSSSIPSTGSAIKDTINKYKHRFRNYTDEFWHKSMVEFNKKHKLPYSVNYHTTDDLEWTAIVSEEEKSWINAFIEILNKKTKESKGISLPKMPKMPSLADIKKKINPGALFRGIKGFLGTKRQADVPPEVVQNTHRLIRSSKYLNSSAMVTHCVRYATVNSCVPQRNHGFDFSFNNISKCLLSIYFVGYTINFVGKYLKIWNFKYDTKTEQDYFCADRCHGPQPFPSEIIVQPEVTDEPSFPHKKPYLAIPSEYYVDECIIKPGYVSVGPRAPFDLITGSTRCIHNQVETVVMRIMYDVVQSPKYHSDLDMELTTQWKEWCINNFDNYTDLESVYPDPVEIYALDLIPKKEEELLEAYEMIHFQDRRPVYASPLVAQTFLKKEALAIESFNKPVRAVNAPDPRVKADIGSYCKKFAKRLRYLYCDNFCHADYTPKFETFIYGAGYNKWQLGKIYERMEEYIHGFTTEPIHLVIDQSRYDLHHKHIHFELQFEFMKRLVEANDTVLAYMSQSWRRGSTESGIFWQRKGMRLTGYNETASGNTTIGIETFKFVMHLTWPTKTYVELMLLPMRGVFLGDDGDIITTPQLAVQLNSTLIHWYSKLGWSIKCELVPPAAATFCSMIPVPGLISKDGIPSEGKIMINYPAKVLLKFGWMRFSGFPLPAEWKQLAYLQALCEGAKENDVIPFLGSFRHRMLYLIEIRKYQIINVNNVQANLSYERYREWWHNKFETEFRFIKGSFIDWVKPNKSTTSYLNDRYDFTDKEIEDLTLYFAHMPSIKTKFNTDSYPGSLIERLIEVDLYSVEEYKSNHVQCDVIL